MLSEGGSMERESVLLCGATALAQVKQSVYKPAIYKFSSYAWAAVPAVFLPCHCLQLAIIFIRC